MKWISVKDKLPDDGTYCFVWNNGFISNVYWNVTDTAVFNNGCFDCHEWVKEDGISHWMPIITPSGDFYKGKVKKK